MNAGLIIRAITSEVAQSIRPAYISVADGRRMNYDSNNDEIMSHTLKDIKMTISQLVEHHRQRFSVNELLMR